MTTMDVAAMPGTRPCGDVASRPHACEFQVPPEPAAHAYGMVHPAPIPGCPWCVPVHCPCGSRCDDAAQCARSWQGSETTWREQAAAPAFMSGSPTYGGGWR